VKWFSHRLWLVVAVVVALVSALALTGCSADEPATKGTGSSSSATDTPAAQDTTDSLEGDQLSHTSEYRATGAEIAVIKTAKGTIKFKFYPDKAPNHVGSFIELALAGFYNGLTFHRVEPNFVVQGGDPYSKSGGGAVGTGGPGYSLTAEFSDVKHIEGTVAMARSGDPNSAGSQFYICLAPAPFLDGQYTVFGQVVEGMDVVKSLAVGDVMESVTIENATE